jgi:hypothetical membrane protein
MQSILTQSSHAGWNAPAAYGALGAVAISLCALGALHLVSREFDPSWRMVSEYANGSAHWLLTLVFAAWAISSFALVAALWPLSVTTLGKVGLGLLFLAGIGQLMGGLFDINHKLHGPAAMIGIPSLCAAAVVCTIAMARRDDIAAPPIWSAHLPWIAFVIMIAALFLLFSSLKAAGVDVSAQSKPLEELPHGVSGYVGWANRFLFLASYLWAAIASAAAVRSAS